MAKKVNKETTKELTYEQKLEEVAKYMNELWAAQIIRNPSKIQQATALQIVLCPKTQKFVARPMKR